MGETNQSETIGQYRIESCVAEGNLARLCRAVDRTDGRRVVIRIVEPAACRNDLLRAALKALRDPQNPRRAADPHFLQILEAGTRDDSYYIVQEDFESLPLDQHLARENPSLQEKLRLARLITECVRAVHGHRMAHGDIKPQNILVGRDRNGKTQVKISLSDLAVSSAHGVVSICGELLATPKYLSPEQARGAAATDGADLFALGVVFYEMFTGREPFPADSPLGYLQSNTHSPLTPADKANPQVPFSLARVLDRLLARNIEDRYRHAQSVLDDLDRVESSINGVKPPPVEPGSDSAFAPGAAAHPSSDSYWKPIAIMALAALCVMLIGSIVILSVQLARRTRLTGENAYAPEGSGPAGQYGKVLSLESIPTTTLPEVQPGEAEALKKSVEEFQGRVKSLIDAKQYDDALEAIRAFSADPRNAVLAPSLNELTPTVLYLKGSALIGADPARALSQFRMIARDYPSSAAAAKAAGPAAALMVTMAVTLEQQGQPERAIELLEQVRKDYPNTEGAARAAAQLPAAQWKLAQSLMTSEPDRAADIMKSLVGAKLPDTEMNLLKRALAQLLIKRVDRELSRKQYAEAVSDLRVLREACPTDNAARGKVFAKEPEALAGLAIQLKEQNKPDEALALWNDLKTRYPAAYVLQERAAEMTPLVAPPPDTAASLLEAAKASIKDADASSALLKLEAILRDFPDSPESKEAVGIIGDLRLEEALAKLNTGNRAEAEVLLGRIVQEHLSTAGQASALLGRLADVPPGMVLVPQGPFTMGLDKEHLAAIVQRFKVPSMFARDWFLMQTPARVVNVKAFYIDECEVTNGQYAAYVKATGAPAPAALQETGGRAADFDKRPVTGVSYDEAAAYAKWAGKRLPTEEEWEKAARGADGRLFPWGNEFDPRKCVSVLSGADGPEPVGMAPEGASPYGALDMVGNVSEWTSSIFGPYPGSGEPGPAADETFRTVRGPAWDEASREFCTVTVRKGVAPGTRSNKIGFRCVKDAK